MEGGDAPPAREGPSAPPPPGPPAPADPRLVDKLVEELKSQGMFDQIRKDCNQEVDTKVTPRFSLCDVISGGGNEPVNLRCFFLSAGLSESAVEGGGHGGPVHGQTSPNLVAFGQ